jgi:5-methylcytosine-specific restriction endonuclease McrA
MVTCSNPNCNNTFTPRSFIHSFCSARCRRAARGAQWGWVRRAALRRDSYTCQDCGASGDVRLECHHVVPVCMGGDSELANLRTLCVKCHRRIHASWGVWYGRRQGKRAEAADAAEGDTGRDRAA